MTSGDADESLSRRGFLAAVSGGAAIAAGAGGAAAQSGTTTDGNGTTATGQNGGNATESDGGAAPGPTQEVTVGPGGELVFDPDEVEITPGTTVRWVWDSNNHNIVVDEQPEGAGWEGTEGGAGTTYDTGHTYSHTFETLGTYEYACEPHRASGMLGTVVVSETAGGGGGGPRLPGSAKTLGVALTAAMVSTLSFAYFFLKYGGDYDVPE
jgi:plastocyanin